MAITGQTVYESALSLVDEVSTTGSLDETDLAIKTKAKSFLTILQAELLPSTTTPVVVSDLADDLLLSDRDCLLVLPYGLAAHLMIQDDPGAASFFQQRYEELRSKRQSSAAAITDNYDVLCGMV
jgi:hypothetical protein